MRILKMRLLAFGPFTDEDLDLAEGKQGLHIVYGPNEAGKSSALRALHQMLYGIPERSFDDFIHPYAKLRIGAALCLGDGTGLEFVRRKGRINTLRTPDDECLIDESQLLRFLGGVDPDLFATMFGIDHAALVKGGKEIILGGGNIGQVLFAAGSGISDLSNVQEQLKVEADALFRPSGQKPRINEAIAMLKKNHKAIRDVQLPGQQWYRHDQQLRDALEHKESVERDLNQRLTERYRLERIKEALAGISRRKELLDDLKTCADAIILPEDFGDRRRDALTNLRIAENDATQARESLEEIGKALKGLGVAEPILENADLIEEIYQDLGSHRKASKDRSRLVIQKDVLEADALAILRELRKELALDQVEQLRLGKAESVRIQELGSLYERLVTRSQGEQEELEKFSLRIDRLKARLSGLEKPRKTSELGRAIKRALERGALEAQYQTECREILRAEQAAEVALKKQTLWTGTLEALEKLAVPSSETIDTFDNRLGEAQRQVTKQRADVDELERMLVEINGQIEQLRLEQEVPTEADLDEARQKREQGWQLVCRAWQEGRQTDEDEQGFVASFPPANDLADAYELSVQHADELSDRLRREADRVAKKATLLADRETRKNQLVRLKDQLEAAELELAKVNEEWSTLWGAIKILPRSPREMRSWTLKQVALADQVSTICERKTKADDLKELIDTHRSELSRCLQVVGQAAASKDETLAHLVERSQQVADHMDEIRSKREQIVCEQDQRADELQEAKLRAANTEQKLSNWRSEWGEAIRLLGLEAEATPAQASAVLEDLKTLFSKLKEADVLGLRIEGIDGDADDFVRKVQGLIEREAPELVKLPVEEATVEINARLTRARTAKTKQQSLEKQDRQQEKQLRSAKNRTGKIEAQLLTMCEEAACKSYEEIPAAEERSLRRLQIEEQLNQLEGQLRKLSGGATLDVFIRDAQSVDPDSIDPMLDRLAEEIDHLGQHKSELDQTIGRERNELARMDGSAHAAELAEEAQGLIARLETDAEHYIRLWLASAVLSQAIERYRAKNQGPILERSNELFSHMTLGSFAGLRLEFDEKGEAVLVGVRPGGKEIVGVEGMSDGTADQLYLAVRLASLEAYLEKNEPLPFIVDDILIKFDNERAIATLQTLAELSRKTQIIFFTHHRHLVELAEANIDKDALFTHSLGA